MTKQSFKLSPEDYTNIMSLSKVISTLIDDEAKPITTYHHEDIFIDIIKAKRPNDVKLDQTPNYKVAKDVLAMAWARLGLTYGFDYGTISDVKGPEFMAEPVQEMKHA